MAQDLRSAIAKNPLFLAMFDASYGTNSATKYAKNWTQFRELKVMNYRH
jgi:hypothetical protein